MLPEFVHAVELVNEKELFPMHADFLSRLGMTFSHGDYAQLDAITGKDELAGELFLKSLEYCPDHRAFLGLGILFQKRRDFEKSVNTLTKGVRCFPHSEQLNICLGVSYMNLGAFEKALRHFLPFRSSKEALGYAAECYKAIGDLKKAEALQAELS